MKKTFLAAAFFVLASVALQSTERLVDLVDPFLGTAPLNEVEDIGFEPPWRVWAGLTFPGTSVPNAMVQLSPITEFGSGAGYEYEDTVIHAFTHTNKGHWNLCHIPLLPVTGDVNPADFASAFSHEHEAASPGYYRVLLQRYGIDAELTSTLRGGFHRYSYPSGVSKKVVAHLSVSNERVTDWKIEQVGANEFRGYQTAKEKVYFYAITSRPIIGITTMGEGRQRISVIEFSGEEETLELKIGLSFVSTGNAKLNLEAELAGRTFAEVRQAASDEWEQLLGKIRVEGGTARQRGLFYSSLYRSFLWPALRSDVNGEFTNQREEIVKKNFAYYTIPSLWDDYRNKLVLLAMLSPKVTEAVIQSMVDRGEVTGFMPTFFHGDHAAPFVTGVYLRGVRGFDVKKAYELLVQNATVENRQARPHLQEYIDKGYVSTPAIKNPKVETKAKAGVTKTLEYAYDDYSVGLLARELGDTATYDTMMKRAQNYRNVFDAETGLMRGRLDNGRWVTPFDPKFPYYEYMYREANAWQSSFFAPHDTEGLIKLYPSRAVFERQLDRLFTIPWDPGHIAMNVNSFIGQYCHGNQPDHGFPYLYYWVGKPEKSQAIIDEILERFYGMKSGRTLCGMDDAGEMSSWYVFNAIGIYPYSPADPDYIVTVPIFDRVHMQLEDSVMTIAKHGRGRNLKSITYNGRKRDGYFISHHELKQGKALVVETE